MTETTQHLLLLAADLVDDLERTRIATNNRLHALAGYGLDTTPEYAALAAVATGLADLEKAATRGLEAVMRDHPLSPWTKQTKGIGLKSIARFLAAVGDPYWNTLHDRPRTVSELWAFCGLHVVPAAPSGSDPRQTDGGGDDPPTPVVVQKTIDTPCQPDSDGSPHLSDGTETRRQMPEAGALPSGAVADQTTGDRPDQRCVDTHITCEEAVPGVAARRRKGQRANWSTKAKTRAYLLAECCMKQLAKPCTSTAHADECRCSPYRLTYDARRAHTAVTRPNWSDGHHHNDAMRVTAKAILRDIWLAARDVCPAADEVAA